MKIVRSLQICLILLAGLSTQSAGAQRFAAYRAARAAASDSYPAPPDYADPADWACRPGHERDCISGLDAVALGADGRTALRPFEPAANPPIDCFYVYPTASREQQPYADLTPGPAIMAAVRAQAGRLASRCRLFAPLYRQATLSHLRDHAGSQWDGPYQDIVAAWTYYLEHDNDGRGVVLIGHSQGAIILQKLLAEHIDGSPAQRRIVSAFLIGDPGLKVPRGARVGGSFQHIPICGAAGDTGCVYSWSSYLEGDDAPRVFGLDEGGLAAVCTDPKSSMPGALDAYFPARDFPNAGNAAFVEIEGQIDGACHRDAQGTVLRIRVRPGANADAISAVLQGAAVLHARDWGLHRLDVALTQGNILHLLDAQITHWSEQRR